MTCCLGWYTIYVYALQYVYAASAHLHAVAYTYVCTYLLHLSALLRMHLYVQARCSVPMYCNYWVCVVCLANCRTHPTSKGVIRKVRFAPGKGNLKFLVLYNNRLEIRNALEVSKLHSAISKYYG